MMTTTEQKQMASDLDAAYRRWKGTQTIAKTSIQRLLSETVALAGAISLVKGNVRGSFVQWCRRHCRSFNPNDGRVVCAVAEKKPNLSRAETWQLRLLGIITPIHHSVRPMAAKRKVKPASWIGSVIATKDKIRKLVTQAGGAENLDPEMRSILDRHLQSVADLRREISG
jgi:hypothetical protein